MSDDDARRETRRAVDATLGGRGAFAKKAGLDPQTLSTFLNGARWPHGATLAKIERALGWPAGRITDMREGVADDPRPTTPDVIDVSPLSPIQRRAVLAVLDAFLGSSDAATTTGAADAAHGPDPRELTGKDADKIMAGLAESVADKPSRRGG